MGAHLCAIDWELRALPAIRRKCSHTTPAVIGTRQRIPHSDASDQDRPNSISQPRLYCQP